ncbi:MAG: hypothetical protein QOF02_667 [Blastocatellia bacterium]|jgi:hypothetical protein|nr:hypothetical protein [Blastocatellia bacterium]
MVPAVSLSRIVGGGLKAIPAIRHPNPKTLSGFFAAALLLADLLDDDGQIARHG